MRFVNHLVILGLCAATACREPAVSVSGPVHSHRVGEDSREEPTYIVVLKKDAIMRADLLAADMVATHSASIGFIYRKVLHGFSARLTSAAVEALRRNPNVLSVNPDGLIRADTNQTFPISNADMWGLERIDQRTQQTNCGFASWCYSWLHNGGGVYAYVLDSGIDSTHTDFGGRARNVFDVFGGSGQDCNGHGTHVAGTIGSRTWGVAKGVYLRGVRVLDCTAGGTVSGAIAGLDWIAMNHVNPAVVNASIDATFSQELNDAVENLIQSGVFVAVSAGNSNLSACAFSPASAPNAVTVAAAKLVLNSNIQKAEYSNWGSCVDVYAPGSFVRSTRLGGGSYAESGTSMAAPHITGIAAIYKSAFGDALPSVVANWIINNATVGIVGQNPAGTPNRFSYKAPGL